MDSFDVFEFVCLCVCVKWHAEQLFSTACQPATSHNNIRINRNASIRPVTITQTNTYSRARAHAYNSIDERTRNGHLLGCRLFLRRWRCCCCWPDPVILASRLLLYCYLWHFRFVWCVSPNSIHKQYGRKIKIFPSACDGLAYKSNRDNVWYDNILPITNTPVPSMPHTRTLIPSQLLHVNCND